MILHIISSGSAGNSYILKADDGQSLLLECGVNFKRIQEALNFNYRNIVGALITHQHQDHCKSAKQVATAGINIYTQQETIDSLSFKSHRLKAIQPEKQFQLGGFKIVGMAVKHDVPCLSFLIHHPESGKILFITDSYMVEHRFTGLNNIIIEANYGDDILEEEIEKGSIQRWRSDRLIQSHMSLETCKGVLMANDLKAVYQIVLIHLSDRNSNAEQFEREIQRLTGRTVHIAKKGMVIPFDRTPF